MFHAKYPYTTAEGTIENKDLFTELSTKQIDSLILQQREWTKVYSDQIIATNTNN